ncbi:MAG: M23 family metallopeptidase, partial [Polyangiaceae bacterium]
KRIRAFEYKVSATEIYQARENEEGKLAGGKLDLHVEQHRVAKALVVKDDIKAAISDAGLDDDLISALDDAFEGRVHLSRLKKGATLRVIAQEQTVAGKFAKYIDIEAVEYLGASKDAKPLRIYHYKGKTAGHYDASGKAPYNGGPWRWPLQTPRITSKFNPQRMHPVLHTIMPHNGCDFGAATGTPIYAASAGTIATLGPSGPSGNLVTIDHGGGLVTGYAHMSKFAPGLKAGDKVDVHQLIGYVGTTGRSTGPHLHFSLKRNGQFVDPLTLKMDGERVIPKPERDDFDALKAELDKLLDGMPLPDRDSTTAPSNDDDPDEDNHEGDDKGDKGDKNDDGSKPDEPKEATTGSADSKSKESKKEGKKDGKKDADSKGDTGAQDAKPVEEGPLDSAVWKPLLANSPVCEPAGYSFSGSHGIDR